MTYASEQDHHDTPCGRDRISRANHDQSEFTDELLAQLPHLRNYALSLTQDSADASELVQDSVLRALEKRHQFTEGTYMRRWLFTILRNRYLDQWRQKARRGPHVPVEDCPHDTLSHPPTQDDWVELRSCERKLGKLGAYDRTILLLCILTPLSHKEIAEQLDVAEGTIRSRLSRVRAQLKA